MVGTAPALLHAKVDPEIPLGRYLRDAAARYGKSYWTQIREIWQLQRGPGKLRPDEYYYYRLYDDGRFGSADKQQFLGQAVWNKIYLKCNKLEWWGVAHDKLVCYAALKGLDLPIPQTRAIYHPFRGIRGACALREPAALAAYLRQPGNYPFFAKPVTGIRSVGVAAAQRHDAKTDAVVLNDGTSVGVDGFVGELEPYHQDGYLFQEMLAPHAELARVCGRRVSTVRLVVAVERTGPAVLSALWKIPVGDNPADNFWRPGNLLAALDPLDGRVARVIQGVGLDQIELERHPDTAQTLKGILLPDWQTLTALCLEAASAFPGLRLQAWDVAPTDRGPLLVEVNVGGDFNLPQLAHAKGMLDEGFRAFVERCTSAPA